jgi:branched-subunit amino acid ABC-type transport system permease component
VLYGLCQAFGQLIAPSWVSIGIYGFSVALLLVRPTGLFAKAERIA